MGVNAELSWFHGSYRLSAEDTVAFKRLMSAPKRYRPGRLLTQAGAPALFVIESGVAGRLIHLPDGGRQILAYLLPGDFCDIRACFAPGSDLPLEALTEVRATTIVPQDLVGLAARAPKLMHELWRRLAAEDAIARQWQVNLGRRNGLQRTAHLLCEFFARSEAGGLATAHSCDFPISQASIADALALSAVHVNRLLQELRRAGLIELKSHRLTILNLAALHALAGFEATYLHIAAFPGELNGAELETVAGSATRNASSTQLIDLPV